jgi:FMN-dependent NADH-azoreductase
MKNVLVIKSSINSDNSVSNKIINEFVKTNGNDSVSITERDLGASPLPHLSQAEMVSWMSDEASLSNEQRQLRSLSESVVSEVQNADLIVIGLPMYNFAVPSNFKSWIDRLARAGVTFTYTENGPVGLLEDKPVYIIATRGGKYQGTPMDSQTQFIKDVLGFVGLKQVKFIYVEGIAMGEADSAIQSAHELLQAAL